MVVDRYKYLTKVVQEASPASASYLRDEVIKAWGGVESVAADLREEFNALPKKSPQRIRILNVIIELVLKASKAEPSDEETVDEKIAHISRLNMMTSTVVTTNTRGNAISADTLRRERAMSSGDYTETSRL